MKATTRRQFLKASAGASAGVASWLALGRAPAFAQKRELSLLSWNHFVPAADDELRKQAEAFGKQANCTVRVDTMAHLQMPAKIAAEAQSQSGHDMYRAAGADAFLYEHLHANVDDVVDKLGKQYGGWYPFSAEMAQTKSGWKAVPWFWISFPATYNMAHFKKAGFENPPKTWAELLSMGKTLTVASNAFNHPPLRHLADHPIWARNPKFAMLPKEAEYGHPRGWPGKPSDAVQRIDDNYVMADMVAKAVNGMPTKRAMEWAQDQIARAIKGQLKVG